METLFRLIHVSDFHFGNNLFPQGNLYSSSGQTVLVQPLEVHDLAALEALSNSVRQLRRDNESPIRIIVTGDLTTFGTVTAFDLAFKYLRGLIDIGGGQAIGFNDSEANVVPGNHDIWGAATLNPAPGVSSSSSTRDDFDQCCNQPAPLATYPPNGIKFPYRVELYNSPLIYLYGLDSTRLDAYTGLQMPSLLADGFVDDQQLIDLESLVKSEPNEPRLRIVALHHFLKRPHSKTVAFPKGKLLNPDKVILELERIGVEIALCGHLHEGFIEPLNSPTSVHLLAVGTSAQKVNISNSESNALLLPSVLLNQNDRKLREQAVRRTNEYRLYEFVTNDQIPDSLYVVVNRYIYVPKLAAFQKQITGTIIPL